MAITDTKPLPPQEPPMQKTEHRAFAAVMTLARKPWVIPDSVRRTAKEAREAEADGWYGGWPEALRAGVRIRPVLIRVEDEGEGR